MHDRHAVRSAVTQKSAIAGWSVSYVPLLEWSLLHRGRVHRRRARRALAGDFRLVPRLGTELIPQISQGEFNVDLRLPRRHAARGQTDRASTSAQRAATQIGGVDRSPTPSRARAIASMPTLSMPARTPAG